MDQIKYTTETNKQILNVILGTNHTFSDKKYKNINR